MQGMHRQPARLFLSAAAPRQSPAPWQHRNTPRASDVGVARLCHPSDLAYCSSCKPGGIAVVGLEVRWQLRLEPSDLVSCAPGGRDGACFVPGQVSQLHQYTIRALLRFT
jgi:hypothetical protein